MRKSEVNHKLMKFMKRVHEICEHITKYRGFVL